MDHPARATRRGFFWLLHLTLLLVAGLVPAARAAEVHTLTQAVLQSASGSRPVRLPDRLERSDFAPQGGRVHYQLALDLTEAPSQKWAIHVRKLSLAGRLWLNGREVGACELGRLEEVRCLNRPYLFVPPLSYWQAGRNLIEFEIHASQRQLNGLSAVVVGEAQAVEQQHQMPAHFWLVDMLEANFWLSLLMGVVALVVAYMIRDGSLYLWVGVSSVGGALSKWTLLQTQAWISVPFFTWVAYSSRVVVLPLTLLAVVAFFRPQGLPKRLVALAWTYIAGALVLLWVTDVHPPVVTLVYLPGMAAAFVMLWVISRWAWQRRAWTDVAMVAVVVALIGVGVTDWYRFRDVSEFGGAFLMPYAHSALTLVFGAVLLGLVAQALAQTRREKDRLAGAVVERSQQLQVAQERISTMERTLLKLTENIPVGTFVLETDAEDRLRFTFLSDRFLKMMDLDRAALLDNPGAGFRRIHPEDHAQFMHTARQAFAQRQPLSWTGRVQVAGTVRWVNLEVVPRALAQGGAAWEGVMVDVSDRKAYEAALQQAHESLTASEVQRSALEERERLLQDMHDGFGSQLSSARILAEQGQLDAQQLRDLLQECMADLYLVVDTLGSGGKTLPVALGDLRFRTDRRLAGLPVKLHWDFHLDQLPELSERSLLALLRILQEGISNAIRHAGAANVWVSAQYLPLERRLCLSVSDDGIGLPEPLRPGRGLRNMRQRARDMQAQLHLSARSPGTELRVELPL